MIPLPCIDSLRLALRGRVIATDDDAFAKHLALDNGRIERRPGLFVLPACTEDIVAAIRFARERNLPFTVKGGGHSYSGYCLNEGGVVLDMGLMKQMTLDREQRTLRVQMGAIWLDVYRYLEQQQSALIAVGGACDTVGLPGFLMGGGYSFVSRSYGLGCDNLLSLDMITADGRLRHLSAEAPDPMDRELFWACRGGGGGNFGVATVATLRLHEPNSRKMLAGIFLFPFEEMESVLAFYNQWAPTLPDAMAVYGYLGHLAHPVTGQPTKMLRLQPVFNGDYAQGFELLRPVISMKPLRAEFFHVTLTEYMDITRQWTTIHGRRAYTRSGTLPPGSLNAAFVSKIRRFLLEAPSRSSFMLWMHQGGQTNRVAADATAYPHRDAAYIFELAAVWEHEADTRQNVAWAFHAGEQLAPHFTGAFINYIDPLQPEWPYRYYKHNYDRLLRVKAWADPEGLFLFQQGIGSSFNPESSGGPDLLPLERSHVS